MTLKNNPFEQEENLKDWLEKDQFYLQSKRTDYLNFRKTIQKPGIFMSLQETYLNIVNNITKHSITATLIMLFALGGVGASAAELFAPEDYKPSTVAQKTFNPKNFETNLQKEKNPYTALKPDEKNDVVISEKCDLAIKYPKNFDGKSVSVSVSESTDADLGGEYLYIKPDQSLEQPFVYYSSPSISCSNKASQDRNEFTKSLDDGVYGKENKNLGVDFIKSEFGWFITEVKDLKYRVFENPNISGEMTIYFDFKDKDYFIIISNKAETIVDLPQKTLKSLMGNQIQIQFNSLVENEANSQIVDKPNQTQNSLELKNETFTTLIAGPTDDWILLRDQNSSDFFSLNKELASKFIDVLNDFSTDSNNSVLKVTAEYKKPESVNPFADATYYDIIRVFSIKKVKSSNSSTNNSQTASGLKTQAYTNPYFPNFKLNYDDSWKFERKTKAYDINPNLLEGTYTLTKNNTQITVVAAPVRIPSGCGGGNENWPKGEKVGNFYRYQEGSSVIFSVNQDTSCILDNKIATNIKLSDVQYIQDPNYNYKAVAEDTYKNLLKSDTVIYNYSIRIESVESPNSSTLQEAENIIQNSVFK